ncbi:MAG: MFS transporter [Myxococcota bacterium]|nr:MFS transporter [Myxococcota bacterium]
MKRSSIPLRRLPSTVWIVAAASTVVMSGFGMIVPLIPVYSRQLGASAQELGLLMAGLFCGRLLAQIPAGMATDGLGRRPVLLFALAGYAITCLGYATATTPTGLIAFRVLQGISAGFFSVAARSLMSDLAGPRLRGTAQGVYSSSVNLGFVLGPIAAGTIAAADLDITLPFFVSAGLSCIALCALAFFPYPAKSLPVSPIRDIHSQHPSQIRRDGRVFALAGTNLCFMAGLSAIMALFPIAGEAEIAGGIAFVGPAYAIAGIAGLIFGPYMGRLSDRVGRSPILVAGTCLAAAEGTALFLTRSPYIIAVAFLLGGIGVAAFFNSLHAAVGDLTTRIQRGRITGIIGFAGESGGIAGSLLAPLVWQVTDLKVPFGLQIGFSTLAVALGLWLWRRRPLKPARKATVREPLIPG